MQRNPYDYRYTFKGSSTSGATAPAANAFTNEYYIIATEAALSAAGVSSPYGGVWRARNKDYNKIYYNPDVTYTPWEGADATGANYSNVDYLNAPYSPYRATTHGTVDLTSSTSMTYTTDYCAPSSRNGDYLHQRFQLLPGTITSGRTRIATTWWMPMTPTRSSKSGPRRRFAR